MADATPGDRSTWRLRLVVVGLLLVWAALAGRLLQVQCLQRAQFAARAARQQTMEEVVPARPGDILDRSGRLLATTTRVHSLYVDPSRVASDWDVALMLGRALHLDPDRLYERLWTSQDRRFLWIKRRLTEEETEAVRALDLPRHAWGFRQEFQRIYPQGRCAAHVLGLRDIDGVGRGGVEQSLDHLLRGRDGRRTMIRDARGYVLDVASAADQLPEHGSAVRLTIDAVVQVAVEQRLDTLMAECRPVSACAIVLDPRSGEVLALSSRPDYDPNDPRGAPDAAWTNTAVTAAFEPGSTFKPCVVAQALDDQVLVRDEEFDCGHGSYRMGRRLLHDHHPYGRLTVTDILVKSSNIGMARIGERLTNARLHAAALAFGFGRRTGIELPGEAAGFVRPLDDWNGYSTGSVPMGQELSATPLQVIAAHAVLANRGRQITPHLVLDTAGAAHASDVVSSRIVSEETARWLVEGPLAEVVSRGTGQRARIEGVRVFGKSGTAQKFDPATGGYSSTRHVSSFVCGAPADDPRVLVLVSVNEPAAGGSNFGGVVAAPAAADILRAALSYVPDDNGAVYQQRTAARETR